MANLGYRSTINAALVGVVAKLQERVDELEKGARKKHTDRRAPFRLPAGTSPPSHPHNTATNLPPCIVRHEDAGGKCERPAVMELYGLPFCVVHGAGVKSGCLEELYLDAEGFLELFDAPHDRAHSPLRRGLRSVE